jgi:hypothetical protein
MVRFTVVWHRDAEAQLAGLWLAAIDKSSIARAADRVDIDLAVDPETKGVAITGGRRILAFPPLLVYFEVSELDRLARVAFVELEPRF